MDNSNNGMGTPFTAAVLAKLVERQEQAFDLMGKEDIGTNNYANPSMDN